MPTRTLFASLIIAASLSAQVVPPPAPLPVPPPPEAPALETHKPEPERQLMALARPDQVTANADLAGSNGDLWLTATGAPFTTGVTLRALAGTPNVFAQLGTNTAASGFHVANATGTTLMKVQGDGVVTIGSTYPYAKLAIATWVDGQYVLNMANTPYIETNTTQVDTGLYLFSGEVVSAGVTNSGTLVSSHFRAVNQSSGTLRQTIGSLIESGVNDNAAATGAVAIAIGTEVVVRNGNGSVVDGYGIYIDDVPATANSFGIFQAGTNDKNYFGGSVAIGTTAPDASAKLHVAGNIVATNITATTITGTTVIGAVYQDIAEWVPATTDMAPGTVVVLNPQRSNEVMPSSRPYDTSVAGVVSEQPGVILGVQGPSKEQIATTGRVRVRVDATAGPIAIGDLLVTGNVAGTAMKSIPVELGPIAMHRPGTIVGKALEPLAEGVKEILVLLSLH